MKRVVIILILIFFKLAGIAQSITGSIFDEDRNSIPFATVNLRTENELIITKIKADESGDFRLNIDTTGIFILSISMVGYANFQQKINVKAGTTNLEITLERVSEILEEIEIIGRQKSIVRKIDRTIINVSKNPSAIGKSSLELLKTAPGVFVNRDNISINGVSGTQILVNGRKIHMTGSDLSTYLNNLKTSEIESVEVIPHPSAEYDASGSGGIINIILKKSRDAGLSGNVVMNYGIGLGKFANYNPSTSINYKRRKLEFSLNYNYSKDKSFTEIEQLRTLPDNGIFSPETYSTYRQNAHNTRLEGSYTLSKVSDVSFYFTNNTIYVEDDIRSESTIIYPNNQNDSYSFGSFPTYGRSSQPSFGLNYNLKLDSTGSQLKVLFDIMKFKKEASSSVFNTTEKLIGGIVSDTSYIFNYPSKSNIFTSEAIYDKKVLPMLSLKSGIKLSLTSIDNENFYSILQGSQWNSSPKDDFSYLYKENVYATFLNLNSEINNNAFQIGLRAEQSDIQGNLISIQQDTTLNNNYINLFPSLFYMRTFAEDVGHISFSYNKRIQRPSFLELNPFTYFIDNYTQQQGNPYLKPEISNNLETALQYKDLTLSLGYSHSKDVISTVIATTNDGPLMTISSQNAGINKVWNSNLAYEFEIADWWQLSNNLLLTYSTAESPYFDLSVKSFLIQTQQDINLSRNIDLSLTAFYTPRVLEGNIITSRVASVDAGINMKLLNERLLLRAAISDIFYTNNFEAKSYFNNSVLEISQRTQSRRLSLSMIYNFSFGKSFLKKDITKSNSEEGERLGK